MFRRFAVAEAVLFLVQPLTDRYLVEQLAVCGTCVFPLVWRVSDHNTALLSISRSRTLQQKIWTGRGCVTVQLGANSAWSDKD